MNEPLTHDRNTRFLTRDGGRIGYDSQGEGPLLVLVPGMGDLRGTYRFLVPLLAQAGFRVVTTDLRGQGESDANFASYGDDETAGDIVALIEELGGGAVIVGNSMGAAAGVLAAAQRPDLVRGLVLVGPVVRNVKAGALKRQLQRLAMVPIWAAPAWNSYLPKLYAGRKPTDFAQYRRQVVASLRRPGYARAFSLTTRTNHDHAEAQLAQLHVPVLIVMGRRDPDFADPLGEAGWISERLDASVVMIAEAGHYPQSQQPDDSAKAILGYLGNLGHRA